MENEDGRVLFSLWGRRYVLGSGPLFDSVQSAGRELLAAPISLAIVANGQAPLWQAAGADVVACESHVATLRRQFGAEGIALDVRTSIEYDGMALCEWRLWSDAPVLIDSVVLEIPLVQEHACYLYHYPGEWGQSCNARALPPEGFSAGFTPFIWLGDEERGLGWFTESDECFRPADPDHVTEVSRDGSVVTVRIELVGSPVHLGQEGPDELRYCFGLQATPVKPVKEDAWDYRTVHAGNYGLEADPAEAPATLSYSTEGQLDPGEGTLHFRVKPLFDPARVAPRQSLLRIGSEQTPALALHWTPGEQGVSLVIESGDQSVASKVFTHWSDGDFHHVAATWGRALRVYCDGVLAVEVPRAGLGLRDLRSAEIAFGGPGAHLALDELAISSREVPGDSVAQIAAASAPYPLTDDILLLDRFDEQFAPGAYEHLDGNTGGIPRTRPERGQGGVIGTRHACAWARFVPGAFGNALQLGFDRPILDHLAEAGVRTICFHEQWTDAESYTRTAYDSELRSLVKACHDRGMKILLYLGFLISDLAPEFDEWADRCIVEPRRGYEPYEYPPQPPQRALVVCYNSPWQDFLAEGVAELMSGYDVDGVYLDGTANPWACANARHGCGYLDAEGQRVQTYPILATRSMMRRIYTTVRNHKPDGQVNVHQSTCMTIPTLSWSTSYWDGEQFGSIKADHFALQTLPLDAFRTEFMGHQWGVPAEFLCYHQPFTFDQACALCLLHDVPVRPNGLGPTLELQSKLWRWAERFGRRQARWIPYWRSDEYARATDEAVLISLYHHGTNGVTAVMANMGADPVSTQVQFGLAKLGLSDEVRAENVMTGEQQHVRQGSVKLELPSLAWRMLWLRGA